MLCFMSSDKVFCLQNTIDEYFQVVSQDKEVVEHREGRSLRWPARRMAGPGVGGPPLEAGGLAGAWAEERPPPASAGSQMHYCAGDAP